MSEGSPSCRQAFIEAWLKDGEVWGSDYETLDARVDIAAHVGSRATAATAMGRTKANSHGITGGGGS